MTEIVRITSRENPRIKATARLSDQKHRRQTGLFTVEGWREVERAARAGVVLRELYFCPELDPAIDEQVKKLLMTTDAAAFEISESVMRKLAYRQNPAGVLAVCEQRRWELAELAALPTRGSDLWLVAVGLTKPGNLGAMARTGAAAGVTGILLSDCVVDVYNPNAIRSSTGAVFELPIVAASGPELLAFLRERGASVIAADPHAQLDYAQANLREAVAVVIGAEDSGLPPLWRQAAGERGALVRIGNASPIVDSLNASVAAAVVLFEAVRQRGTSGRAK